MATVELEMMDEGNLFRQQTHSNNTFTLHLPKKSSSMRIIPISDEEAIILDEEMASFAGKTSVKIHDESTMVESNPVDAWLPMTESRKGNMYKAIFHLISSGIGSQALLIPLAFTSLGWAWGTVCLTVEFAWQLYTIWLLVQLHESVPGTRFSRYLHLSIASFGPKLGKILGIFPVMYQSGGACALLIINASASLEQFYRIANGDSGNKGLTGAEWFLVFICLAIFIAQFLPNLNSVAWVSFVGMITAIVYCTVIWIVSVSVDRPDGVSYSPSDSVSSETKRIYGIMNGIGTMALAFRGHNLVLEIQGTLPSSEKHPSRKPMWRGVVVSYSVIAMVLYPIGIAGYWAYGNMMPSSGGILSALYQFHGETTSKFIIGATYLLVVINSLCLFQIYAMPVFDNLEMRYTAIKQRKCSRLSRGVIKVFFGGLVYLISVAFPFLGSLAGLIGGLTLPLAYVYPCFMWISIRKPRRFGVSWWFNLGLGLFGVLLSVMLVTSSIWKIVNEGMETNFFKPK